MNFLNKSEFESWMSSRKSDVAQCVNDRFSANLDMFETQTFDGLAVFDLGRFFWANFASWEETMFWITAKGPFGEDAEQLVFEKFLAGINPRVTPENDRRFLFNGNDAAEFVATFSLCVLLCWDFWIVNESTPFVLEHSHDCGAIIKQSSSQILKSLKRIGYSKNDEK